MFCSRCGSELSDDAKFCKKCGTAIKRQVYDNPQVVKEESNEFSNKDKMTTGLLCLLLGIVGGHRFYTGNKKTGIIMCLLTILSAIAYILIHFIFVDFYDNIYDTMDTVYKHNVDYNNLRDIYDAYGELLGNAIIMRDLLFLQRLCIGAVIIWVIYDLYCIFNNRFKDGKGRFIV